MKKQQIISFMLGIGVFVFIILFIHSEIEKKAYAGYLSDQLVNHIGGISQSSLYSLGMLQDVIKSGKLTIGQARELQSCFEDIAMNTQDVGDMGTTIGRLRNYSANDVLIINSEYSRFFLNLHMKKQEIKLTDEQIDKLKIMESLMQEYDKVVKDTMVIRGEIGKKGVPDEFSDYYHKKGITDNYWINLLKGYERVTDMSYRIE